MKVALWRLEGMAAVRPRAAQAYSLAPGVAKYRGVAVSATRRMA